MVRVPMDTSLPFLPWFCQGRLFHLCMVCNWLVSRTEKHFSKHDKSIPNPAYC